MKNIQVIDGAMNCAYDIFAATDEEFKLIFPNEGQDIQFAEDIYSNEEAQMVLSKIWQRRTSKKKCKWNTWYFVFINLNIKNSFILTLEKKI